MLSLQSKTNLGLYVMLAVALALNCFGKLTPEMVDVLKFVAGGFFTTRCVANYSENMKK